MNIRLIAAVLVVAATLAGCAGKPQRAIAFTAPVVTAQPEKIGVAMTALPKVDTSLPGAGCLLCLAAASIANSTLTGYTHTLPKEDLPALKQKVAELLRKKGLTVVVIDQDINVAKLPKAQAKGDDLAKRDFSSLGTQYGIDHLIVIDIWQVGFERPYADYIPSSDPKGAITGLGYEVNLKTNAYEWYAPVTIRVSAEGKWDEPPRFPGLTNAYFQALELGKDKFLNPFNG
ncbi:hypothetical protein [Luteibacter sp. dw_328]|uniref:hypothetical protein n=1 Tax=Luteibacter sp. dw_328 TaxID=2719796 RepID=UPI002102E3A0|nr:hypothetical protein [Luteibacter sp. dw_328]